MLRLTGTAKNEPVLDSVKYSGNVLYIQLMCCMVCGCIVISDANTSQMIYSIVADDATSLLSRIKH